MRYVAAYLLAVLGGNESPTAADIEKILGSVGIDVDEEKLSKVISELKGKNISEVIHYNIIKMHRSLTRRGGSSRLKLVRFLHY